MFFDKGITNAVIVDKTIASDKVLRIPCLSIICPIGTSNATAGSKATVSMTPIAGTDTL